MYYVLMFVYLIVLAGGLFIVFTGNENGKNS